MIRVQRFYQLCNSTNPLSKSLPVILPEGPGLIGYLPGKYCRIIYVGEAANGICPGNNKPYMILKHYPATVVLNILRDISAKGIPARKRRQRGLTGPGPLQIFNKSARPLPCIIQVEHSLHFPLSKHNHKPVQTS